MTASNILGSMNKDGSRLVMHPADVKGFWNRWRRTVFGVLIAIYVAGPLIPVGGHPMIQLDVPRLELRQRLVLLTERRVEPVAIALQGVEGALRDTA